MRYLVDTDAKVITAIGLCTLEEVVMLNKIIVKLKGYSLEFGGEPKDAGFKAFAPAKFPEDRMSKGPKA